MMNIACDQYVVMDIKGQFKRSERHVVDLKNAHGRHCKPLTIRAKFYLEEHNFRSQLKFQNSLVQLLFHMSISKKKILTVI